jgi:hypothetical protein
MQSSMTIYALSVTQTNGELRAANSKLDSGKLMSRHDV